VAAAVASPPDWPADRGLGRGGAAAAAAEISGELDVRRDDRVERAARHRGDRGGLPDWMRNVALVGIGAVIGTRFARMKIATLLGHVHAALGSFAIAIVISAPSSGDRVTTNVRIGDIIVAFAPGAMDAMLALALTLHIDPIFVGAHHLSRFVFRLDHDAGHHPSVGRPQEDVDD